MNARPDFKLTLDVDAGAKADAAAAKARTQAAENFMVTSTTKDMEKQATTSEERDESDARQSTRSDGQRLRLMLSGYATRRTRHQSEFQPEHQEGYLLLAESGSGSALS
jgi:hypothetical protein